MNDSPINIIDPHLHLFDLSKGKYDWLKEHNPPHWPDKININRNFNQADLTLFPPQQLAGFVHIEAGFDNQHPWREIDWLEHNCTLPFKSVAYADLCSASFSEHIMQLKQRASVTGIRYILDNEADRILSSDMTHKHLTLLQQHNLSFDAQLSLSDDSGTEQLTKIAETLPLLKIIINHGGWPLDNTSNGEKRWKSNLLNLSHYNNVAIKLSGWEMSDRHWNQSQASKALNSCLEIFGEQRVMLASNFPLCTFSNSYSDLWRKYNHSLGLSELCFNTISYKNALIWYKFND